MGNNVFVTSLPFLLGLLLLGALACLPAYKWNVRRFIRSSLCIKVVMWLPLYLGFLFAVARPAMSGLLVGGILALIGIAEWTRQGSHGRTWWYLALYLAGCAAWPMSTSLLTPSVWMVYCLASVFSDVMAYFLGTYAGKHSLPEWINPGKSYEGVAGQLIGGILGVFIFGGLFSVVAPPAVGLAIGVASALGDIANSIAKRRLGIKDWGQTIPGHGGVMDRFSSLGMVLICIAIGVIQ